MPTVPVNEAASPNGTPGPGAYSPQYSLLSHSVGARNFSTYAPRESPAVWTSPPATPELSQTKGRRREAVVPDPGSNRRLRILPAAERFAVARAAHLAASREPIGNGARASTLQSIEGGGEHAAHPVRAARHHRPARWRWPKAGTRIKALRLARAGAPAGGAVVKCTSFHIKHHHSGSTQLLQWPGSALIEPGADPHPAACPAVAPEDGLFSPHLRQNSESALNLLPQRAQTAGR
eukprot:CAMPEP_0202736134 /NCGR_PEP_ID=MMETSP1388-20130828/817_1 /ASSEMBLY_ACC=CAM_ASM_000864 /TAXON_ID=37098 /ORGANISM="Isochrysis sp, Strain CCMP1244" /LENGTH=234 /DNA_ID=CAMNT_0049402615 /DNA_START=85 /DNA_END=788 /DNA_ORIENTATION=+